MLGLVSSYGCSSRPDERIAKKGTADSPSDNQADNAAHQSGAIGEDIKEPPQ